MQKGRKKRRDANHRRHGAVLVRTPKEATPDLSELAAPFAAALRKAEALATPYILAHQLAPAEALAKLVEIMQLYLTSDETPSDRLASLVHTVVLGLWSNGLFTPSAAFPYSYDDLLAACNALRSARSEGDESAWWLLASSQEARQDSPPRED